jgi:hypothetical protein
VITKLLVSGAIVLGAAVGLAAPAGADPEFNNLICSCAPPGSVTSPDLMDQINQGIRDCLDLPAQAWQKQN